MKTLCLFLMVLLVAIFSVYAQPPDTLWTRTYGGSGNEVAFALRHCSDGGYIMAGSTWSQPDSADFYVVRTNEIGDTIWTRTYGGSGDEFARDIQQTSDGGYVIVGSTNSFGAACDNIYLVKTDNQGITQWTRNYGGVWYEDAYSVMQTPDNGYIIAGTTSSFGAGLDDFYLVKTDDQGDTLWTHTYGGVDNEQSRCLLQTSDGGYIVGGYTTSFVPYGWGMYLVKTDDQGDTLWTHVYSAPQEEADVLGAYAILQTSDSCYLIAGYALVPCMTADMLVIKTNSVGDTLWMRIYPNDGDEAAHDICPTDDGGYVLTGYNSALYQDADVYLVKIDSLGNLVWSQTYGGDSDDEGHALFCAGNDSYVIAGCTSSFGAGGSDFYLISCGPEEPPSVPQGQGVVLPKTFILHTPYPNPFNATTVITYEVPRSGLVRLTVHNLLGQQVATIVDQTKNVGTHSATWNSGDFPSGIYFCRMSVPGFQSVRKMILIK